MEGTIGEIRLWAAPRPPRHWVFCAGQARHTLGAEFAELFELLEQPTLPDLGGPQHYGDAGHAPRYIICYRGFRAR